MLMPLCSPATRAAEAIPPTNRGEVWDMRYTEIRSAPKARYARPPPPSQSPSQWGTVYRRLVLFDSDGSARSSDIDGSVDEIHPAMTDWD